MNKSAALFLILTTMVVSCIVNIQPANALDNQWIEKAPMPTARFHFGAASVNCTIYAIGGLAEVFDGHEYGHTGTTNVNEAYDPATDAWVEKAPMPGPNWLDSFGIVVHQGKIYCIGGPANNVYDPATDTWEAKKAMPTPRHFLDANVVDGKIYLIGGRAMGKVDWSPLLITYHVSDVNEVYDPATNSWTEKAPIPHPIASYASAVVNNKIYIISGCTPSGDITGLVQVYDPQTDNWSSAASIPNPVENAVAGAITNNAMPSAIYVIGGCTERLRASNQTYTGSKFNQVYFPENDSWTVSLPMPDNRYGLSVVVVNNMLYAIGGVSDTSFYSPTTYQFTTPDPTIQPSQSSLPSATEQSTTPPQPRTTVTPPPEVDIALGAAVATVIASITVLLRKKSK